MDKVLSFGELLLRLSPPTDGSWIKEQSLPIFVGGAELNVARALALWDIPAAYCTALPDNLLSDQIITELNGLNIDTRTIHKSGNRIGLYYLPVGSEMKNAGVIYDRANSAYAELKPGMINWDKVFDGVKWFHFSAICPALNQNVADVCEEALKVANAKGVFCSVDLNYRAKLWQSGRLPADVMPPLLKHCNFIMGNVWAAEKMAGIPIDHSLISANRKESYIEQARKSSDEMMQRYPSCKAVANTYRFEHAGAGVNYYTVLKDSEQLYTSKEYTTELVVDKVGSGDCFMAGLIYGYFHNLPKQETLDFATMAAFQKLFIRGDAMTKTVKQIHSSNIEHA